MRVALVSSYELGHQPIHVASPAARLEMAGHEVRTLDLATEHWDDGLVTWADAIAFSTPMHTALRLATTAAEHIRTQDADLPLVAFGLYADNASMPPFSRTISGEYEDELLEWIEDAGSVGGASSSRRQTRFVLPQRSGLPRLDAYARLAVGQEERLVGAVEASHGCIHRCRHCPLPTVYDGRIRIVDQDVVLEDIAQLVDAGARHITFSDADFLNGPHHSMRIVNELHRRWPDLTYDATIKVEHLHKHQQLIPQLVDTGCLFVVSAFESLSDDVLDILDKGHTAADAAEAMRMARDAGLDLRPTWLPFTPWTRFRDLLEMYRFMEQHDLMESTDPIQMTVRLLVPRTSLLADHPRFIEYREDYDDVALGYRWANPHPGLDELAAELASEVERRAGHDNARTIHRLWQMTLDAAGEDLALAGAIPTGSTEGRPRLTEPWFC